MNKDHVMQDDDRRLLLMAVEMAMQGVRNGGGPFGAVIVRNGAAIAEAHNRVVLNRDPTAHAEIQAIRLASTRLGTHDLSDCMLYSSCEPCPMCLGALYWAGITRVVFACDRRDAEQAGFSDKLIYEELDRDPAARKVEFVRMTDVGGQDVFAAWEALEDKVRY